MSFWKYWLRKVIPEARKRYPGSLFLGAGLSLLFLGCQKKTTDLDPNIRRGKALYHAACTVCHHSDPKKEGAIGPAVWGSSLELLQKKIKEGIYPEGYTPKRTTHLMQPLPQLSEEDVGAIYAYLNQHE